MVEKINDDLNGNFKEQDNSNLENIINSESKDLAELEDTRIPIVFVWDYNLKSDGVLGLEKKSQFYDSKSLTVESLYKNLKNTNQRLRKEDFDYRLVKFENYKNALEFFMDKKTGLAIFDLNGGDYVYNAYSVAKLIRGKDVFGNLVDKDHNNCYEKFSLNKDMFILGMDSKNKPLDMSKSNWIEIGNAQYFNGSKIVDEEIVCDFIRTHYKAE